MTSTSVRRVTSPSPAPTGPRTTHAPAPRKASTPVAVRKLRRLQLAAVALILAFGALVVTALSISLNAAAHADESFTQYNRLADARVQALEVQQEANTWALTPTTAVRTQLDERLATLSTTLADAAGVADDRDRVVPLTGALVSYGMTLQNALNANGDASAAILAKADTQLSAELLEPLDAASTIAGDRLATDLNTNWLYWVIGGAVLAGGGLIAIMVALATASHRRVNLGVAAGVACALISAAVVAAVASSAASVATDFIGTDRASLDAVSTTRQQAHQARADELLAVGLKASGGTYLQRWTSGYTAAKSALGEVPRSTAAATKLTAYNAAHTKVVAAVNAANWSTAASTVLDAGGSTGAFTSLDTALNTLNANTRSPVSTAVSGVRTSTVGSIAGVIVLTLLGAGLAFWGVSRRIEEYR